jgi:hypothetical protein
MTLAFLGCGDDDSDPEDRPAKSVETFSVFGEPASPEDTPPPSASQAIEQNEGPLLETRLAREEAGAKYFVTKVHDGYCVFEAGGKYALRSACFDDKERVGLLVSQPPASERITVFGTVPDDVESVEIDGETDTPENNVIVFPDVPDEAGEMVMTYEDGTTDIRDLGPYRARGAV